MHKNKKRKKLLLVFLLVSIGLILFSSYIKTTEVEFSSIFGQKKESKQNELFFETEKKIKKEEMKQTEDIDNKNNSAANRKKKTKIESITLIKEIKDPFKTAQMISETAEEKDKKKLENEMNKTEELIFLEKNITAENLIPQTKNSKKMTESEKQALNKLAPPVPEDKEKEEIMTTSSQRLENIRLPFKLLGIIKNKTSSSALFLYQNQTLLKKEKENIDVFRIEKINNNNLTISYQKEERIIYLWKEKNNENH